jgi:hypothetical protein
MATIHPYWSSETRRNLAIAEAKRKSLSPPDFSKPPSSAALDKVKATTAAKHTKPTVAPTPGVSKIPIKITDSSLLAPTTVSSKIDGIGSTTISPTSKSVTAIDLAEAEARIKGIDNYDDIQERNRQFDNESDKKATEKLIALQQSGTSLDAEAEYFKPIAFLDTYAPYVKVKIFAPKKSDPNNPTAPNENIGLLDTEFLSDNQTLIQNNYVESLSLSAENGPLKFTLKLIDTSLNFSDTLLMRFAKQFSAGIYLEISYGWSNRVDQENIDRSINNQESTKPVIYINTFVGLLQDVEIDEGELKRTLTITGMQFDTMPGELMYMTPYNELGPYPMMTYQFINFLALNEEQKFDIIKTASHFNANAPKDIKEKEKGFNKDKKFSSVMGSTDNMNKIINSITNFHKELGKLTESDSRVKLLNDITAASTDTKILDPGKVLSYYTNKEFKKFVQAEDSLGIATKELMERFTTIIRDIRIHPWVAFKYIIGVMNYKMSEGTPSTVNPIVINDFVGAIQTYKDGDKIKLDPYENKLAGWDNWDKKTLDKIYRNNDSLKVVGILPTDIVVGKETSWGDLINSITSKCFVFVDKELKSGTDGEVETELVRLGETFVRKIKPKDPKDIAKAGAEKDPNVADLKINRADGKANAHGAKNGTGKLLAEYRSIEPMKSQCFCGTKKTTINILKGEILLNEAKLKMSARSASAFDKLGKGTKANDAEIVRKANEKIKKQLELVESTNKKAFFYNINLYNSKQSEMFDKNFGGQAIHQAYSYRFQNQNEYAYSFNPGIPSLRMINFPDVLAFKPDMKGAFTKIQNVISASKFLKIDIPNGVGSKARIVSSDYLNGVKEIEEIKEEIKEIKNTLGEKSKSTKEEKEEADKQLKAKRKRLEDITKAGANITDNPNALAMYNNPIYLDMSTSMTALNGNGLNNNSVGILKNNIVNFRKRFMMDAQATNATLDIMGDASYKDTVNFMTELIYVHALNPDGSDSMHTGIYRLSGYKHELNTGSFKSSLMLVKDASVDNEVLKKQLNDVIYADMITKEEAFDAILKDKNFQKGQDVAAVKQALRKKYKDAGKTVSEQTLDKEATAQISQGISSTNNVIQNTNEFNNQSALRKQADDIATSKFGATIEKKLTPPPPKSPKTKAKAKAKKPAVSKIK